MKKCWQGLNAVRLSKHRFWRRICQKKSLSTLPLEGIRVLDMTRVLAGPYATMVLGDLGAEIIKVEKPGSGDDTRSWGPPFKGNESVYFMSINRNKKSVCIDFKTDEGLRILKKLVAKSDVFIENYLPGKLTSIGLGYDELVKGNPGLIYCSISGFGQDGPYRRKGGYDLIASAIGGLMHITGPEGGDPCRVGVAITDITTGLYAHVAILAAIIERGKTGVGKYIDCSLLSTQVAVLSHLAASYLNSGIDTGRLGTAHQSIVPYQGFRTSDGYLVIGTGNNRQFEELCKAMELGNIVADQRFNDNPNRVKHRKELVAMLQAKFETETTDSWSAKFETCSFPFGPINSLEGVFDNSQVKHLDLVEEMVHPDAGTVKIVGPAVSYNGQRRLKPSMVSPTLGQDTREVLCKVLGYGNDQIDQLHQDGVAHCA